MKFILCEDKFLLNENPSFILEERFILNEAILLEAQATLKQLVIDLNKIDTLLPELLNYLPLGKDLTILSDTVLDGLKDLDITETIKTGCDAILTLLTKTKEFKAVIQAIRKKAEEKLPENNFSEEAIKILQPLCYNIASDGNSVKDRLKSLKNKKGDFGEQLVTLQERLPKLKAGIEELYKFFEKGVPRDPEDPSEPTDPDPIKYFLDPNKLELAIGETSKIKLMSTPKQTEPIKATFSSNNEKIIKVNETGEVTAIAAGEAQIQVVVAGQTLMCNAIVKAAEDSPKEPEIKFSLKHEQIKLASGKTFELKILATPKPKEAVKATFSSDNPAIATVSENGTITAISKGVTQIKVTIGEQTLSCKVIVTTDSRVADWEDIYKQCTECANRKEAYDAFWTGGLPKEGEANPKELPIAPTDKIAAGYFKGEWGNHAERIMSLGTSFIKCLKEVGWSETLNPFVALLKYLCKFDTVFINDASFTTLQSLYKVKIYEDDLRGKGKLGNLDLVRNPMLYKHSSDDIATYLTWQHTLLSSGKLPEDTHEKVIYANIAAAAGNVKNLEDATAYKTVSAAKFVYDVRKLSQYKEIIKAGFDIDGDKHKVTQATDKDVEEIISKVKSPTQAKKLLTYLVNLYRVIGLGMLKKLFQEPFGEKIKTNRNTTSTSFEEDTDFDLLLNTAVKKYSLSQLKTFCTKLLEIAKL